MPASILCLVTCLGLAGCRSIVEYKQAQEASDEYEADVIAKAEAGYANGKAIYEAAMAEPVSLPPTLEACGPWLEDKVTKMIQADQHFADVQLASSDYWKQAYETHLMLGEMGERLAEEVFALEGVLTPKDYYWLHRSVPIADYISAAEAHFDAWRRAGYADTYDQPSAELRARIDDAERRSAAMNTLWEKSRAVADGEEPADAPAAAGDAEAAES